MSDPKERVRVQAGRGGGPKGVLPAAPSMATMPAVRPTGGDRLSEPTTLYQAIIHAARDPAIDAAKVKTLVELQIIIEEREAKKAFTRAFNDLQFKLPAIDRDGKIDHGEGRTAKGNARLKTSYSTYPNLMRVCRPLLKSHGFTFNNVIEPSRDGVKADVVAYLTHVDGHFMVSRFPLTAEVSGNKNNQQGFGSGASYGKRYNLILILDIVSEAPQDLDNDGYARRGVTKEPSPDDPISSSQLKQLLRTIDDSGVGADRFCDKFEIRSVPELPSSLFNDAMKACQHYAQEVANRRKTADDDSFPGDRD